MHDIYKEAVMEEPMEPGSTEDRERPWRVGERRAEGDVQRAPADAQVRDEDLEPHEGLRYIARLFKVLSVLLVLMLIFEIFIGLAQQGSAAVPTLIVEATRLIVFAGLLWGMGDLALMFIESNHDLRATRILMGRLNGKMQRLTDIEADELELLAGNPALSRERLGQRRGRMTGADPGAGGGPTGAGPTGSPGPGQV
jgi:hypothetical protein